MVALKYIVLEGQDECLIFFSLTNFQSNELVPAWLSTAALQMIPRRRAVKQQLLYYLS